MKLLRFGAAGAEKPGLLDKDGVIRDLSGVVSDITPETLKNGAIETIAKLDPSTLPIVPAGVRLGPIVEGVRNFIAVGLNYVDHAHETGAAIPSEPILFNKAPNCIIGPNDAVTIPKGSQKTDWEVELAIVIGKTALYVSEADALSYVAGFAVCHDVSERAFQTERGGQWMKGKGSPTFGPLGPWLVTPDEIADVQNLDMFLDVNGTRAQTGNTKTMIFGVAHLVSYISQFLQLDPGDVITTGTPPGVGMGMKPPKFLKDGDKVRLGITGLGEQEQTFHAYKG
ncbi:fumarylacetoacetate hydrolase family protein [Kaistia dalseonensis]|uniref:2-keto-4-pentenoate hydratase/2-oxohepta-3-ene-1,7-dioic acid hydratase in catechol pathway n=1 Tax=Kaistia dalseonensis TaxID=410840 RepID=A0ABU0H1B6_9HYPH|nr:fumarylacetoacetate hydrolase family protein [Kaistia dalseonensis]MCX5493542.1 fumarylacetoacetate hydrolase family protein [Kaistia dalseonensis]MDQ0436102.1 2-keto-4-pentenoate hydratase/2-oxohepta-3-ene-1,7-dioic acid hydratase in catechol pathway [Kaistia dalseonensis]